MARALTSPELALLRSNTQWSKLYLAIYQPNVIYTALLNGVPTSNDRVAQITFDGGSGTLGNVKAGMTLYVGTSAGAYDLGMCRIRKAAIAGTFYIGLISEIAWADNCYLTVVDDFDLWTKHPTVSGGVLSMDVDIAYSDQHSAFSPVPMMGSHACVWLDEATVDVEFDGSDAWVIGSTISAYAWTAPGSSASSGMTTATPTITYNAAGNYCVYCTVTAANGKATTGVRHVFVFDRTDHQPATVFQLAQCVGSYDAGGWMFDMSMEAEASLSEIRAGALVVLFAEDWYGTTKQSIGPLANRENIVCVGRMAGESIRWDRESGLVHFTVQGAQHWLSKLKAFAVDIAFVGASTTWSEMSAMTVDRVLWHILYWRSTVIETMDVYPTNSALYTPDGKTIAATIWGQVQDMANTREMAWAGVNRFGQLFIEREPQMIPEADRDWATVMALTSADWQEGIEFGRNTEAECSQVSLASHECNSAGTVAVRYSYAPGHIPLRYGEPEMGDRLACANQSASNQNAGLLLGWRNNEFPDVPVVFAMNNRMLDLFPRQFCSLTMATTDNPRGVAYDGNLIPRRISLFFDGDSGFMHPEINFEGETFEQNSTNGDVPESEDVDMSVPFDISLDIALPDMDFTLPGSFETTVSGPPKVLVHDAETINGAGLLYSNNFNSTSPTWIQVNAGLTVAQYRSINKVVICPNGAVYVGQVTISGSTTFLARAPYIGGTFAIIENYASISAKYSGSTDNIRICAFNCNRLVGEQVVYALTQAGENIKFYEGAGTTFTARATGVINTNSASDISYGAGAWMFTASGTAAILSANAATITRSASVGPYYCSRHIRISTSDRTIHWDDDSLSTGLALALCTGNAANVINNVGSDLDSNRLYEDRLACDLSGLQLMTRNNSSNPVKSSDGGYSWSVIGALPVLVSWYFAYAGNAGAAARWIAAGSYLYYSENFGSSWSSRAGNLTALNPLFSLNVVKVVQY